MKGNRTWLWIGGALAGAVGALVLGVPLRTVLTVAALLVCPAAMFLGMGMMGGMQPAGARETHRTTATAAPGHPAAPGVDTGAGVGARDAAGDTDAEDPIAILRRRLAKGELSVEEYERLATVISGPIPASRRD